MINTLQAGRFFAAMAVVLHHANISIAAFVESPPEKAHAFFNLGYLGVDFFFVLSGFIIHYTLHLKPRPAGHFAIGRLTRILLPYWPIGILLALAYMLVPALSDSGREWGWLSTLTLFPSNLPPALSVAWTLQHELVFYLIYAVLFFSRRMVAGLTVWSAAIVCVGFMELPAGPLLDVVLAPINLEFIAGVGAAAMFLSPRCASLLWSSALSISFLFAFVQSGADRAESWMVGFAIAAFLPWLCQTEQSGAFVVPKWLVFGGAASYAIYLTHNPLLSLTSRIFNVAGIGWIAALILSVLICTAVGVAYYLAWERPIMKVVQRKSGYKTVAVT